eukprot:624645-Rhodomonas_salina.1
MIKRLSKQTEYQSWPQGHAPLQACNLRMNTLFSLLKGGRATVEDFVVGIAALGSQCIYGV